jgi:putative ABC transport system permease protein
MPGRSALVTVGVSLGVALMVGIRILNSAAASSLTLGLAGLVSDVDLTIRQEQGFLSPDLATDLETVPGVAAAFTVVSDIVFTDDRLPVTLLGIDLAHPRIETAYARILLDRDLGPAGLASMAERDSVLIPERMARRLGLSIGSSLPVHSARGTTSLRVGGLLRIGGIGTTLADALIIADVGLAADLLSRPGSVDRIDVMALERASLDALEAALSKELPGQAKLGLPEGEFAGRAQLATAFIAITGALSTLGLIVGFFLIYSVLSAAIIAESRELARLRLQGATRRDLLTVLLAQAGWQALPGILLGAALGVALAVASRAPFLQGLGAITQSHLDAGLDDVSWGSVCMIAFLGLPTAIGASWLAVHRWVALSPLQAVTGAMAPVASRLGARAAAIASVALTLAAMAFLVLEVTTHTPVWGTLAIGTVSSLIVAAAAALAAPTARLVRPLLARMRGVSGELAADGLFHAWSRSAVTIAVFAIGIGTATCGSTIFYSAESLVLSVLRNAFRSELVVTSAFRRDGWVEAPLDIDLAQTIARVDGVVSVETERVRTVPFEGRTVTIRALEGDARGPKGEPRWIFVSGDPKTALAAFGEGRGVFASRNLAHRLNLQPGASIRLEGERAAQSFEVLAVVEDFASADGSLVMTREHFANLWDDRLVTYIWVHTDRTTDEMVAAIRSEVGDRFALRVVPVAEFVNDAKALIAQIFHFTHGITGVTFLIAGIALVQSIVSGALESRRELSIFRAIGASKRQLAGTFVMQGALLGSMGAGMGIVAGLGLSLIWMWIHLPYLLDWVVPIRWPFQSYLATAALAPAWSALAAELAARWLVRLPTTADLTAD